MTRILIVDDEEMSRTVMEELFGRYGKHASVSSGKDALIVFEKALERKTRFDLVLLDISLDDISGLEVLKKIREMEAERGVEGRDQAFVAMVTAHSERETVVDCIEAGCRGYFIKPLKQETVDKKMAGFGFSPEG